MQGCLPCCSLVHASCSSPTAVVDAAAEHRNANDVKISEPLSSNRSAASRSDPQGPAPGRVLVLLNAQCCVTGLA